MRAPHLVWPLLVGALGANLGACAPVSMVGAASVNAITKQERTMGETLDDAAASADLRNMMIRAEPAGFAQVGVEVASGRVLLTGSVANSQLKALAEQLAWMQPEVRDVANALNVGKPAPLMRRAMDDVVTSQIRARMISDPLVSGVDFNIETYDGVVYLLGLARTQAEVERAAYIASTTRGVDRVVSYVDVRNRGPMAGPPAPVGQVAAQSGY